MIAQDTRSQPHTHSHCWGIWATHTKQAQDTFSFSRTHTGKSDRAPVREHETNTQARNDWPQQICVHRLAASSLNVLWGLTLGFSTGPVLHYTGHHIKALTLLKTRLCQQVPPLYQLYPCYSHQPATCKYTVHTKVLDRNVRGLIRIWKWTGWGGANVINGCGFKCKAIFLHLCDWSFSLF